MTTQGQTDKQTDIKRQNNQTDRNTNRQTDGGNLITNVKKRKVIPEP